jgi:hypothetical protein
VIRSRPSRRLLLAFAGLVYAMYPGRFDGDAISQYAQGLDFHFDDTHSVLDAALLGALSLFAKGPGPMFVLQLALYVGGILLVSDTLILAALPFAGLAVSVLALLPLLSFDYFDIQKDALLSALLVVLIGIGAGRVFGQSRLGPAGTLATACVLMLALDTRQNAVFALAPLWFLFRPLVALRLRPVLAGCSVAVAVFAVAEVGINGIDHALLKAERSHLQYALIVFDLAGITARTGQDASEGMLPELKIDIPQCYTPRQWDDFYLDPQCRPVVNAARMMILDDRQRARLTRMWLRQIASHPVAYLSHRMRNFQCLIRLGCRDSLDMNAAWGARPWNEPGMRVTVAARALGAAAGFFWHGPFGAGVLWIVVLLAELGASGWRLRLHGFEPLPYMTAVMAASGLIYTLSFAVVGVADQLRYLHPLMVLAIVCGPLAIASHLIKAGPRAGPPP